MDSIADLLVRIKNAIRAKEETVDVPHSKVKEGIVKLLQGEGYIGKYDLLTRMNKKYLRLFLKYNSAKKSLIEGLKRVSRPGRRVYVKKEAIVRVQSGFGTAILSTVKGIMTGEEAREKNLGGEVLCSIW